MMIKYKATAKGIYLLYIPDERMCVCLCVHGTE